MSECDRSSATTTSSPARPSPSTCPRPRSALRMASGLIDVAVRAGRCWSRVFLVAACRVRRHRRRAAARRRPGRHGRWCSSSVPDRDGDADPRPVARQAGPRACARSATTPGRSRSGTPFVRALVGVVEIWVFTGVPALFCALVSAARQAARRLAAGTYVVRERFPFPRRPAGADAAARSPRGRRRPTSPRCPTGWPWPCASSSTGASPQPGLTRDARHAGSPTQVAHPRRARRRRRASTPRRCSPPCSPSAGAATRPGWPATRRSGPGCGPPAAEPVTPAGRSGR